MEKRRIGPVMGRDPAGNLVDLDDYWPISPFATVHIARRDDGGLRVWSDTHPGLVLSGKDPDAVAADIWPALKLLDASRVTPE